MAGSGGLLKYFQRKSFLAGQHMQDQVQGTMDLSMEWPLDGRFIKPVRKNGVVPAGDRDTIVLAQPQQGYHQMVLRAMVDVGAAVDAGARLSLLPTAGTFSNLQGEVELGIINVKAGMDLPLVETVASDPTVPIMVRGIRPQYVWFTYRLEVNFFAVAGTPYGLTWLLATLPETQPITTLFNY